MLNDALQVIERFVATLDEIEIDYYIGGSIASIVYGTPRTTRDVDFVLTMRIEDAGRLVASLERAFYVDRVAVDRAVATGDCFNAIDIQTMFQADVFTPMPSDWLQQQFERRERQLLGAGDHAVEAYICSPEDTVLNKLRWFSLGNEASQLQWQDAVGILVVQTGRLDEAYLQAWASRLELGSLLERAKKSADLGLS